MEADWAAKAQRWPEERRYTYWEWLRLQHWLPFSPFGFCWEEVVG